MNEQYAKRDEVGEGGTGGTADFGWVRDPHTNRETESRRSVGDATSQSSGPDRYHGLPVVVLRRPDGTTEPAPFLMDREDLAALLRLHDCGIRFPEKTIRRYRRLGLRSVRIGRRVWFRLDDVLRFLDAQQDRLG
jgi:hypothetical protein